ncbi:uncharacterized protein LOC118490361 [Helianthus annuus]|uniref:uncharacterized protein LOC118490361 n=1 Tax=Helianthus annuus TaxID=4232 RepID=UPI0016532F8E|nr:uncharacterized protein LOC118490361 [Helianthus annuus]
MRRLYLDRKRSRGLSLVEPVHIAQSFTSVTMPENSKSMAASVSKERRKIRKTYLDSKRSKETFFTKFSFQQSILQPTTHSRNGSNCKVNITNHAPSPVICTNETFPSPLADIRKVSNTDMAIGSGNIQSSISSRHVSKCKENNIKDTSYSCLETHSQVVATNAVRRLITTKTILDRHQIQEECLPDLLRSPSTVHVCHLIKLLMITLITVTRMLYVRYVMQYYGKMRLLEGNQKIVLTQVIHDTNKASSSTTDQVDLQIIEYLKKMLDSENILVKNYRMVRDSFKENPHLNLRLRLNGKREKDGRTYNLPTASEVAALIVGDIGHSIENRDIVVETKEGNLKHISELYPSYLALQYPLLFPYGEDCYRVDIPIKGLIASTTNKRKTCSMREFFAYRIQDRVSVFSLIHNSRRLFQQFLVDAYTMIEAERLNYIRFQQKSLRSETYENLKKLRNHGNTDLSKTGKKYILSSSFTGGSRYMMQNYLDAMSICNWFGYPDIFITVTCNSKWPEVKRFLKDKTINPEDRPDILDQLFKVKLDSLIKDLKDKSLLGKVSAVVYTVEFQKRGLPHAHICLFMDPAHKFPKVEHIDPLISAKIPDKNEDMELYTLVGEYMIHGRCGSHNINCVKKKLQNNSVITRLLIQVDFLYNEDEIMELLSKSVVGSIKYLFKYINKGPDKVTVAVDGGNGEDDDDPPVDEIKKYYDCRYVSACEASWRIFRYDIHYSYPTVIRLPFHLPNQQNVVYGADDYTENVLNNPLVASSMFLSWMECNKHNELARTLTYVEFPTKFVWKSNERCWQPRQTGKSIGRIHHVCPALGEAYFLRILLNKVKGPKCFDDILAVNGRKFKTFREACYARGLLDDDKEYIEAIQEASITDVHFDDEEIKNFTLCEIEKILNHNNSTLRNWSTMPYPDFDSTDYLDNRLILEKLDYDKNKQKKEFDTLFSSLTDEQSNCQQPFGGKTIVFGRDFRQILSVIPSGSRQDIVNASLSSAYIWNNCKVLRLTKNMRLTVGGEGNIGGSNDGEAIIEISDDLIMDSNNHVSDLIDFVYPSIIQNFSVATFFQERAILAPTMNEVVDEINDRLLSLVPGDEKEYLSFDSICESENRQEGFDQSLYSPDVLNGLKISGLPHHRLVLKVGVPVMLLRNIDQRNGLCNGTRLKVLMLGSRVIEAEVISGSNIGKRTFIPRIALTPSDKKIPFKLKRRQFPIVVCFAMTINKSQGQSLSKVGLFLRQPVFSHCQLYVTLSRVKSRDGLKLVIVDKDGKLTNTTLNVVYKEVFRDL